MHSLYRYSLAATCAAALAVASAHGQGGALPASSRAASPKLGAAKPGAWNDSQKVTFKGTISGIMTGAPYSDGKKYVTLLVKLADGISWMVELGPKDYVEAQALELKVKEQIWVAGCKCDPNDKDSLILAERVNFNGMRPSFRKANGTPFWK